MPNDRGGSINGTCGNWHQSRQIWTNAWAQGAEQKRHKGASGGRSPCWLASSHAAHGHRHEPGGARDACGITFQQIQKYEKGMNRMGASRLHQIARILQVPVEFFYKGVPSGPDSGKPLEDTSSRSMTDFLGTSDGLELVRAFMAVKDAKVRRRIVDLTKAVAA